MNIPTNTNNTNAQATDPNVTNQTPPTPAPQTQQQQQQTQTPPAGGDQLLAGKYKNVQELERAYLEAQKKLSAPPSTTPPATDPMQIAPSVNDDDANVVKVLQSAGLKPEELTQTFQQQGKLTDEQYAALKKVNPFFTKGVVDDYMRHQMGSAAYNATLQQQARNHAAQLAGGDTQLQNLLGWASTLPDAVKANLNDRLADPLQYEGAVIELMARHKQAVGAGGSQQLVNNTMPAQNQGVQPFSSNREAIAMRRDPRMKTDPNFRALYEARLDATPSNVLAMM